MLTWAILWCTVAMNRLKIRVNPGMLVLIAMICDVFIVKYIAEGIR